MKRHFLVVMILALLAFFVGNAFARGVRKVRGMKPWAWKGECYSLERLDLSGEQREAVYRIDAHYKAQILQHRNNLMLKRIELLGLLRDPNADKEAIQAKAREMGDAREALQKEMIDYQIEIRSVLSPEQIRRWCTMMGEPFSRGGWNGAP